MNTTINLLGNKLLALMDDVHFRYDSDKALDSPEQLLAIGEHYLRQFEKIEAMGEEHQERIMNIMSNILASVLQEKAITKYGNTDHSSIRQVLDDWFNQPEDRAFFSRLRELTKRALLSLDLTEDQCTAVLVYTYDKLPQAIIEVIEELTTPMYMLPRSEAQPIAMVLADMMREVRDADRIRYY